MPRLLTRARYEVIARWSTAVLRQLSAREHDPVPALQGRFRMIKRTEGVSSTDIVGRMLMCTRDNARFREARPGPVPYSGRPGACRMQPFL